MREHDAKVLRGAAIPTLVVGGGSTAAFLVFSGTVGVLGALCALLLVLAFFGVSGWAVARLSRRDPNLFMPATLGAFLIKALILAAALLALRTIDPAWIDTTAFAVTSLLCVIAWLGGHVRVLATSKTLHVDPEPSVASGLESRHEST